MKSVVLFDLDGTVVDSKPGIFQSAAYALDSCRCRCLTNAK